MLLRARARPRPASGGRPPRRHAAALGDPLGGPRRRAAGDPRGDQHARGLARGPGARPVHRDAVAGPSARPAGPRHGRDDRGGDPRRRSTGSTSATTCPGTSSWPRPATSGTTTCSSLLATRMETGRALPEGDDSTWNLRTRGPPAVARRHAPGPPAQDRAGAHLPGDERPGPDGSGPVRVRRREHGARRRDVVAAVPGDPGEARAGVLGLQLPLAVHRGRAVHDVRGHDAGARRGGDRPAPPRARGRRVRRPHRGGVRARARAT